MTGGEPGAPAPAAARRRALRPLLAALLAAAALAADPAASGGALRAQSTACDRGDSEVRALDFRGNRAFADRELAVKIVTTASSWSRRRLRLFGERRCLDPQELRLDRLRLQTFYRERGFYEAKVDTLVEPAGPDAVRVAFLIEEGEPIRIDSLAILGAEELPEWVRGPLVQGLPIRRGMRFDKALVDRALEMLRSRLWNQGYPRAEATRGYSLRLDRRTAIVELTVLPGQQARIGAVRIDAEPVEGREQQIPDDVAKRISRLREGNLYRDRDLVAAQRNLYQTNAYRHVDVRIAPDSAQRFGDSLLVVSISLQEDLMRQLDTEIGWGSLDCVRTRAVYTDKNFLNGARRFELTGQLSKVGYGRPLHLARRLCDDLSRLGSTGQGLAADSAFSDRLQYYVGAGLRQPSVFGSRFTPAFTVYSERRGQYQAFLRTTVIGGELSAVREISRATPFRLAYTLEYGRTQAEPALLCAAFNRCLRDEQKQLTDSIKPLAVASASVSQIRTDDPMRPTRGTGMRFEVRSSHRALGSANNLQFNKGIFDGIWYAPFRGAVFSARLRLGAVLGTRLDLGAFDAPSQYIPPQERLYAGGATSVRGFQQNELGGAVYIARSRPDTVRIGGVDYLKLAGDPTQGRQYERVVPTGGNALVVANFDYRIRSAFFPELIQYAVFTDVGQVWTRNTAREYLGFKNLKWTPGVGLRIYTPVGPFQVNVAYNPYARAPGPIYYDEPYGTAQKPKLLCLSPIASLDGANDIPASEQGVSNAACAPTFAPMQRSGFIRKLNFTFSIGPEF